VNSEHILIYTGGAQPAGSVIETVLVLVGNPETGPTGRPDAVFFGFREAAASIGPSRSKGVEVSIILERAGASHLGAKDDASALFDLLAANTDWGLELLYNDGGEEPDRVRPLLTGQGGAAKS
jgi:hypothetical protein